MKTHALIPALLVLAALSSGCSTPDLRKEAGKEEAPKLAETYLDQAQQHELRGELVEALESYRVALTVDPGNSAAAARVKEIESRLNAMAIENYKAGVNLQRVGKYAQARQKLLTAVRYKPDYPEAVAMLRAERIDSYTVRAYFLHVIKPGELLANVAERYYRDYLKHYLIGAYNEVEDAAKIGAGQTIKVPVVEGIACFVAPEEADALSRHLAGHLPPEVVVVKAVVTHTTQAGESLPQLSQRYYGNKDRADLIAKYNNLHEPSGFKPGRKLLIPQVQGAPLSGAAAADAPKAAALPGPPPDAPKPPPETKEPAPEGKAEPPPVPLKEPPPAAAAVPVDLTAGYRQQGLEFLKENNYPAAIAEFKKVLSVNPRDPAALQHISQAHFGFGVKSFEQKSFLEAVEHFKSSLTYDKSCAKCEEYIRKSEETYKAQHYVQGLTHFQNEKLSEAIQEWELVHALDPGYRDVGSNLQKARSLQERLDAIRRSKPQ
ncbi:MAG: LysM domain-containing protein [Desulfobacterales bacterium]